ncbi:protein FAR1-RELATED SEQUENCE 12-like [Triticum aestivum]|uniref:protein FAR1-RELATED SEQUENCE 12-like n=1 Tax=Triticum aestivum TaxID=4565 RepID=UPI000E7A388F|nr:protein FAR1-RELATED SEQUENCE 12-like [Triticum aestivum]
MQVNFTPGLCLRSFGRLLIEGTLYNVKEGEKKRKYVKKHDNVAKREKWSRVEYEVTISEDQSEFTCESGQFEHTGMLCNHVLRVMDILHLEKIPAMHILKYSSGGPRTRGTYFPNTWFSIRRTIQLTCRSHAGTRCSI